MQSLGVMRYVPVASAAYVDRYLAGGFTAKAAERAPLLAWNRDDALQDMLVRKMFRRSISIPTHFVATAEGFGAAMRSGLGWGAFPVQLVAAELAADTVVRISDVYLDVPLFSQCWKLDSPVVKSVTDAIRSAAKAVSPGAAPSTRRRTGTPVQRKGGHV